MVKTTARARYTASPRTAHAVDPAGNDCEPFDDFLAQAEVLLLLDAALHRKLIRLFVGLGSRAVHGGPLGPVEHAELDARFVDHASHLAPQGVDLPDDLPLGNASDGGVAAHLADGVEIHRDERGFRPQAGRGEGRFAPRMARPDHDNVKIVNGARHRRFSRDALEDDTIYKKTPARRGGSPGF